MASSMSKAWEEAQEKRPTKSGWALWEDGGPVPRAYRKEAEEIRVIIPNDQMAPKNPSDAP